ncbi:MAG: isoprenylcysteine carboxylmethyltransferase family protein [Anaerolineae bacterium]|nr:isoprenylcysteine carboxylmethyltransferase family protein [Anaerolineae bacterium]
MEILVSLIFTLLGMVTASRSLSLTSIGLSLYNLLVAWMYFNHRPAKNTAQWWETALAVAGTFLPLVAFRPAPMSSIDGIGEEVGMLIQLWGLLGMIWSVFSLGTALGIAPADRGLVTSGPYHRVRHPMYTFEIVFCLGYWLVNLTWMNAAVWLLLVVVQATRALREERAIEGYAEYAGRVRWRFIPGVV